VAAALAAARFLQDRGVEVAQVMHIIPCRCGVSGSWKQPAEVAVVIAVIVAIVVAAGVGLGVVVRH